MISRLATQLLHHSRYQCRKDRNRQTPSNWQKPYPHAETSINTPSRDSSIKPTTIQNISTTQKDQKS